MIDGFSIVAAHHSTTASRAKLQSTIDLPVTETAQPFPIEDQTIADLVPKIAEILRRSYGTIQRTETTMLGTRRTEVLTRRLPEPIIGTLPLNQVRTDAKSPNEQQTIATETT